VSGGELSAAAIAAAGLDSLLADVLAQPHQIGDALWRIDSAAIPGRELPGGVAVCGYAIAGDLAAAALADRATGPVRGVRGLSLEPWTRDDTLVLCASYSGDDDEALASFEDAGSRGAQRVVVCTAGALAARAREEGVPVIGVPAGMAPGAAVVYFTLAAVECAALAGAGPSLRLEAEAATPLLGLLAEEWGPDAPGDSPAKSTALALRGRVPVIHGAPAVARYWAERIEEIAAVPAFWRERLGPVQEPLEPVSLEALEQGQSLLERVLSLVLLGDLVSIYLAALGASAVAASGGHGEH
jgi:glucose/mannose-6-phosphate isomerase